MPIDPRDMARLQQAIDVHPHPRPVEHLRPLTWDDLVETVLAIRTRVEPPPPPRIEWGQDGGLITCTVTHCPSCCDTGSVPTEADDCGYTSVIDCACATMRRTARVVTQARMPTIPPRATLATYSLERPGDTAEMRAARKAALDGAHRFLDREDIGLSLLGGVGTGKTHILVAIGRALMTRCHPVRYATWGDVVRDARAHMDDKVAHRDPVPTLLRAPVLLLDEVGSGHQSSDWQLALAEEIIAGRADRGLPTAIASNLTPHKRPGFPAIIERIGPRAWDRMSRMGAVVTMPDGSQR